MTTTMMEAPANGWRREIGPATPRVGQLKLDYSTNRLVQDPAFMGSERPDGTQSDVVILDDGESQPPLEFEINRLSPGLVQDLAYYYQSSALVPDTYAAMGALFTIAGLLENRFRMIHDRNAPSHTALSLYLLLVGPARLARKSTLMEGHVLHLLREVCGREHVTDCTVEAIHEELYASVIQMINLYYDEFSSLLGNQPGYQRGLDVQLTRMYNGNSSTSSRKSNKTGKTGSTLKTIQNFAANICGCTTAEWLFKHVKRDSFLSGFLIRFIPVFAQKGDPAVDLDVSDIDQKTRFRQNLPPIEYPALAKAVQAFYERLIGLGEQVFLICSPQAEGLLATAGRTLAGGVQDELGEVLFDGMRENIRRVAALIEVSRFGGDASALQRDKLSRPVLEVSGPAMTESLLLFEKIYHDALLMLREHLSDSAALVNARIIHKDLLRHRNKLEWFQDEQGQKIMGFTKTTICRCVSVSGGNREQGLRELTVRGCLDGPISIASANPKAKKPVQIYRLLQTKWA